MTASGGPCLLAAVVGSGPSACVRDQRGGFPAPLRTEWCHMIYRYLLPLFEMPRRRDVRRSVSFAPTYSNVGKWNKLNLMQCVPCSGGFWMSCRDHNHKRFSVSGRSYLIHLSVWRGAVLVGLFETMFAAPSAVRGSVAPLRSCLPLVTSVRVNASGDVLLLADGHAANIASLPAAVAVCEGEPGTQVASTTAPPARFTASEARRVANGGLSCLVSAPDSHHHRGGRVVVASKEGVLRLINTRVPSGDAAVLRGVTEEASLSLPADLLPVDGGTSSELAAAVVIDGPNDDVLVWLLRRRTTEWTPERIDIFCFPLAPPSGADRRSYAAVGSPPPPHHLHTLLFDRSSRHHDDADDSAPPGSASRKDSPPPLHWGSALTVINRDALLRYDGSSLLLVSVAASRAAAVAPLPPPRRSTLRMSNVLPPRKGAEAGAEGLWACPLHPEDGGSAALSAVVLRHAAKPMGVPSLSSDVVAIASSHPKAVHVVSIPETLTQIADAAAAASPPPSTSPATTTTKNVVAGGEGTAPKSIECRRYSDWRNLQPFFEAESCRHAVFTPTPHHSHDSQLLSRSGGGFRLVATVSEPAAMTHRLQLFFTPPLPLQSPPATPMPYASLQLAVSGEGPDAVTDLCWSAQPSDITTQVTLTEDEAYLSGHDDLAVLYIAMRRCVVAVLVNKVPRKAEPSVLLRECFRWSIA